MMDSIAIWMTLWYDQIKKCTKYIIKVKKKRKSSQDGKESKYGKLNEKHGKPNRKQTKQKWLTKLNGSQGCEQEKKKTKTKTEQP